MTTHFSRTCSSVARPAVSAPSSSTNKPRINVIDALRGFALLGILIMNIQSFAMPDEAYFNPLAFGVSGGITESANGWAYIFSHLFADQKFMTIFSLLFGFSMALMVESGRQYPRWFLCKRNLLLILIGSVHAYLIWHGDILVTYALCSFIVVWLLRLSPTALVCTGCLFLLTPMLITAVNILLLPYWSPDEVIALEKVWQPSVVDIQNQINIMQGSWVTQLSHRIEKAMEMQLYVLPLETGWRVTGLMLLGAALHKAKWLERTHSIQKILMKILPLLFAGLAIVALGIYQNQYHQWQASYSFFAGALYNYTGSLLVGFAYVGLFYACYQAIPQSMLMHSLQAVGRTALSNYLLQSVLCTWLFYGHGLGWFAGFDRIEQLMLVPAIWVVQVLISIFWLKYFNAGPIEWLWRTSVDGKFRPLVRREASHRLKRAG